MRISVLCIFFFFTVSCEQNNTTTGTSYKTHLFSVTNVTAMDFTAAQKNYKDQILYDSSLHQKRNDSILLLTEDKFHNIVYFVDTLVNAESDKARHYSYLGQYDKLGFYIVCGSFYEHYECYLIDKRTGKQTTIWSNPQISPGSKFIANLSLPYGLEGLPCGLQIWYIDERKENQIEPIRLTKFIELDQQVWSPWDLVWENDTTFIVQVIPIKNINNGKEDTYHYLRFSFENSMVPISR